MELEINGAKLRVYEDGRIEQYIQLKGSINNAKYKHHRTGINGKSYITSRIIYKAFNPEWDINDSSPNNTIDHINIDSLDNRISNLRIANMTEQSNNRKYVINQKGYSWNKQNKNWVARIKINGKQTHIGSFMTEQEARQAYLDAVALRPSC